MSLKSLLEDERLGTFMAVSIGRKHVEKVRWPHAIPTPEALAKFGFVYSPTKSKRDQLVCVTCQKKDTDWHGVKNIAKHHLLCNKKCPAALFHSAWIARDTFTESQSDLSYVKRHRQRAGDRNAKARESSLEYDWSSVSVFNNPKAREAVKVRRLFFMNWPHETPTASSMIEAGFYNVPTKECADACVCLYCKLSLEDWSPEDDPMEVHRKLSPECFFFNYDNFEVSKKANRKRRSNATSGALISGALAHTSKKIRLGPPRLLDDDLGDSLMFLKEFAAVNAENTRVSEDYQGLVGFERSLTKKSRKYNVSANSSRSKGMTVTKKKQGLLFKDDSNSKLRDDDEKENVPIEKSSQQRTARTRRSSGTNDNSTLEKIPFGEEKEASPKKSPQKSPQNSSQRSPERSPERQFDEGYEEPVYGDMPEGPEKSPSKDGGVSHEPQVPRRSPLRDAKNHLYQSNRRSTQNSLSDDLEIIDNSALISPDKKDPTIYSSSTPMANQDKIMHIPNLKNQESTRVDFKNYSLNPVNLDDSDFDMSVHVVDNPQISEEKLDNLNLLGSPSLYHLPKQKESPERKDPRKWVSTSSSVITSKYDDLTAANSFLNSIAQMDHQLSEDIDGVLTRFISQIPEKEMNMSISEWIEHQVEQGKKLFKLKCDEMVKELEASGERAVNFITEM